jgi:pyrroline-5-carboxylate reductase
MADPRRIAILGAGKIGEALLVGLLSTEWRKPDEIVATVRREERAKELSERGYTGSLTLEATAVGEDGALDPERLSQMAAVVNQLAS